MSDEQWPVIEEWHRVVNERDTVAARAIVTDDVAVGGPRGAATGVETFVSWIESAGIHLEPLSWHPVAKTAVVVEQRATWPGRAAADDAAPVTVATLFELDGDRVASSLRFGSVAEATAFASAAKQDGA